MDTDITGYIDVGINLHTIIVYGFGVSCDHLADAFCLKRLAVQ